MDGPRITGHPDEIEVAAVLALLAREQPVTPDRLTAWRNGRREAVRRSTCRGGAQQTR